MSSSFVVYNPSAAKRYARENLPRNARNVICCTYNLWRRSFSIEYMYVVFAPVQSNENASMNNSAHVDDVSMWLMQNER